MKIDFLTSFVNVLIMVALCVPGYILQRKKMLPEKTVAAIVAILVYALQPMITISSFLEKEFEVGILGNMCIAFFSAIFFDCLGFFIAKLVFSLVRKRKAAALPQTAACAVAEAGSGPAVAAETDSSAEGAAAKTAASEAALAARKCDSRRIYIVASFCGNVGFMGIPVMRSLFPDHPEMTLYTAIFILGFNIAAWTLGVYSITGDRRDISFRRAFLNPPTAALVVAVPMFFLKDYMPAVALDPISDFVNYLADMTLPLSMIVLGIRMADVKISSLFTDPGTYLACFLKLVAVPLASLGAALLIRLIFPGYDKYLIITGFIIMAMPSASMALVFAEMFGGDTSAAVRVTLVSTLFSVITIPLLMLLCVYV